MRAEVRELMSSDAPDGIDSYAPADPTKFQLAVTATIGPSGGRSGDNFEFLVVGAAWFASNPAGKGFRWGRRYLILDEWDAQLVRRAISDVCLNAEGADWHAIALRIARYGQWEFEDYREYREGTQSN